MIYPHFRPTDALSCEAMMERILDWKWAPVESAALEEPDSPRHDCDAWFWTKKREKQRPVSFEGVL